MVRNCLFNEAFVLEELFYRIKTKPVERFLCKALFTGRMGNPRPSARVILARWFPWHSHTSFHFQQRIYKAARVILTQG